MILDRWDPRSFAAAVRSREPVDLRVADLGDWRPEEVVPLCHAVDGERVGRERSGGSGGAVRPAPRSGGGEPVSRPELRRWLAPGARPELRDRARVTVVIPCSRGTPAGLAALLGQDEPVEVRLLWNGGPAPVVPRGVQVERVPWLGHGRTRQAAVVGVTTPYVLFTVDDAIPLGAGFVRTLVDALEPGPEAVWARQVPWPDCSRRTRDGLRAWCPASGDAPATRLDHVCALHRTALLRGDPLDDVPIAEDWAWGRRHRCALVVDAPVLHSHAPSLRGSYRRTRDIHRVLAAFGESGPVTTLDMLRALPRAVGDRDAVGELVGQWRVGW